MVRFTLIISTRALHRFVGIIMKNCRQSKIPCFDYCLLALNDIKPTFKLKTKVLENFLRCNNSYT